MKVSSNDLVRRTLRIDYHNCSVYEFVRFWKKYYKGYDSEEYKRFLNLGESLSREHVLRAVTWKKGWDWKPERKEESFGTWVPHIRAWIKELDFLNSVRESGMKLESFDNELIARRVFPRTIRMRTFVAHVTRPLQWPILDSNVWRAYVFLADVQEEGGEYTFGDYVVYQNFFKEMCGDYKKPLTSEESELQAKKDVDESLFAFGQYIKKYGKGILAVDM